MMKKKYIEYYKPLVQQFCAEITPQELEGLDHLPQPFLPLFGKGYEQSSLRLMFMGQDTKGWGQCKRYIEKELNNPGCEIENIFAEIEDRNFIEWGRNTHSFWGFAMALLAGIHGMPNWNAMKKGEGVEILSSFAWANSNAIELWPSLSYHTSGVPRKTWEAARKAGTHFNKIRHVLETLEPNVIILTCKSINKIELFEGLNVSESTVAKGIVSYSLEGYNTIILHTFHPGYMRNVGGPWSFLNELRDLLCNLNLAPSYPEFVIDDEAGDLITEQLLGSYHQNNLNYGRFEFIEWIASELKKRNAFMSVPTLAKLLNRANIKTSYGRKN